MNILAFGVVKEIMGGSTATVDHYEGISVAALKELLEERFPELKKLTSFRIAVNKEYADDAIILKPGDEIAIIPPVSGG